jgi:ribosomal protein L37AE/L43A
MTFPELIGSAINFTSKQIVLSSADTRECPKCSGLNVRRSHRRGAVERYLLALLQFYPYRCNDCDWRFYGRRYNPVPQREQSCSGAGGQS